jgi:MoaA/NifB/PqqE/SkfB family radical SAM enzyme
MNKLQLFEIIEVETMNKCNRKCLFCKWGNINEEKLVIMPDSLIYSIIKQLKNLDFSGVIHWFKCNEPLLDDRIFDIIKETRNSIRKSHIRLITNGDFLTEGVYHKLRLCGLDELYVTIYDTESMRRISQIKNDGKMKLLNRMKHKARENRGGNINIFEKKLYQKFCSCPFVFFGITSSGNACLCCSDMFGDLNIGNIYHQSITDIWFNSKIMNYYRTKLLNKDRSELKLCSSCNIKEMIITKNSYSSKV